MILREKVIIYLISFVIMIVAIDLLTFLILDDRNMHLSLNKESSESHSDIPKTKDELFPIELSINKWGRDIFYDRSYQYNSWFKLTGITQFEDGNKAIINGNIIKEQDKIKGFTISEIGKNYAILKKNKHIVTLKLKE
jgi:hypothetical protein|tara:strand:- start:876 stop:1289 length:414 start_codon:yes stop_codon:yes gene_type:complete